MQYIVIPCGLCYTILTEPRLGRWPDSCLLWLMNGSGGPAGLRGMKWMKSGRGGVKVRGV